MRTQGRQVPGVLHRMVFSTRVQFTVRLLFNVKHNSKSRRQTGTEEAALRSQKTGLLFLVLPMTWAALGASQPLAQPSSPSP